jgi:long-chain acyl-CoA synthetase
MSAYHNSPEQTAKAFDGEGWLRTGDLGYHDADGYYFITGRLKELIIKGGENIAPREIDEALLKHPAVLEAASVGIPDPNYGQEIRACVVLKPGARASAKELRAFCLGELGRYKTPKEFRFRRRAAERTFRQGAATQAALGLRILRARSSSHEAIDRLSRFHAMPFRNAAL